MDRSAFAEGDGYPSCDGQPCVNMADDEEQATATMAEGGDPAKSAAGEADAEGIESETEGECETDSRSETDAESGVAEWRDKYLRLQAEFDNYRKRTLREGERLVAQKFEAALRQKGVSEIEACGKEFDPDFHEAVARFAAGEDKKGLVIDVVQRGYMLGEKVLRYAKVVVGE